MNTRHEQPNDRPVHPRCAKLLSAEFKCLCEELWNGWDGTDDGLDREITLNKRLEARTGWGLPGTRGAGLDRDESEASQPRYSELKMTTLVDTVERGFWKESENLKTLRGDASWIDDRSADEIQHSMDKLRLHIIDRGYWGDCSGGALDVLRWRVAEYEEYREKSTS